MLEVKYKTISEELKKRIEKGEYKKYLPGIHRLGNELGVSHLTVMKAVKKLVAEGLLIPDGKRGKLINRNLKKRPKSNIIVIVTGRNSDASNDLLLSQMVSLVQKDKFRPLVMNIPALELFPEENFWQTHWACGYIFVYSTLNGELCYQLRRNNIPLVCANRIPDEWGCCWSDYDMAAGIEETLETLIKQGHKRIAYAGWKPRLENLAEVPWKVYRKVMRKYGLCNPDYFFCEKHHCMGNPKERSEEAEKYEQEIAEKIVAMKERPTAIFMNGLHPEKIEKCFVNNGISVPGDIKIILKQNAGKISYPKYQSMLFSTEKLAKSVWHQMRLLMKDEEKINNKLVPVSQLVIK